MPKSFVRINFIGNLYHMCLITSTLDGEWVSHSYATSWMGMHTTGASWGSWSEFESSFFGKGGSRYFGLTRTTNGKLLWTGNADGVQKNGQFLIGFSWSGVPLGTNPLTGMMDSWLQGPRSGEMPGVPMADWGKQGGGNTMSNRPFTGSLHSKKTYFEGVRVFSSILGPFAFPRIGIFVHKNEITNIDLLRHEFGHFLQYDIIGPLRYWGVIAPLSLFSATTDRLVRNYNHMDTWTEWTANRLSFSYFGEPSDWDSYYQKGISQRRWSIPVISFNF